MCFVLLALKQKLPKYEISNDSLDFSYTISNKLTHILNMLISVLPKQEKRQRSGIGTIKYYT